jgi:hypothetical protein
VTSSQPPPPPLRDLGKIRVTPARPRHVLARDSHGQPRTYRLAPHAAQQAAYRRLAVAILGLDVATLAMELRPARRSGRVFVQAA